MSKVTQRNIATLLASTHQLPFLPQLPFPIPPTSLGIIIIIADSLMIILPASKYCHNDGCTENDDEAAAAEFLHVFPGDGCHD
jgi:hypothetical protein